MIKVVISTCFGGFGLSEKAIAHYAKLKGMKLYPEVGEFSSITGPTQWKVPPEERNGILSSEEWHTATLEERRASNRTYSNLVFRDDDISRDDLDLIATVETLGKDANSRFAKLKIVEIPEDVAWHIEEYDGYEHIAEDHRTWRG